VAISQVYGASAKHNAQAAIESIGLLLDYLFSICKDLLSIVLRSDGSPKEFGNSHFFSGLSKLAHERSHTTGKQFKNTLLFDTAYHGATPCDGEQRYVKSINEDLGANNSSFDEVLTNLVDSVNSETCQPEGRTAKTFKRQAVVVPPTQAERSPWKSLPKTRSAKLYFTTGTKLKMGRRRFPCLEECCTITEQSDGVRTRIVSERSST